jgi:alpha-galactosidase
MNAAPPCYNPAHHHARPEESVEGMPGFFKALFDTARSLKSQALVEFCPCGTAYSFFTMPSYNMSVASDPRSSFQVRSKGKTLKALMGDGVAYFGDHVELTNAPASDVDDFASTLGVGGVVGSQFVLPSLGKRPSTSDLTPERERNFDKWLKIYKEKLLSKGQYLGDLYDIGFDHPEAHAIKKGETLYYAFFDKAWKGSIELRGLEDRAYLIRDYEHQVEMGQVRGPMALLQVTFAGHLLLEAVPQ